MAEAYCVKDKQKVEVQNAQVRVVDALAGAAQSTRQPLLPGRLERLAASTQRHDEVRQLLIVRVLRGRGP